jgi:hypothetical protein
MTQFAVLFLSAVMLAGPATPEPKAKAGEMIDNPEYANWAQFKVGSFTTTKTTSLAGGQKSVFLRTETIKNISKDKIVIETLMEMVGLDQKIPLQTREIPAKIAKPKEPKTPTTQPKNKPDAKSNEGDEVITVDGQKFKTHWIESQTKMGGIVTKMKVWSSKDVPGGVVKMTTSTTGQFESTSETTLTKWKADKK